MIMHKEVPANRQPLRRKPPQGNYPVLPFDIPLSNRNIIVALQSMDRVCHQGSLFPRVIFQMTSWKRKKNT